MNRKPLSLRVPVSPSPRLPSFLLAAACVLAAPAAIGAQETFFGWHTDLEKAVEVAAEADKPVFAVFRCVR